MYNLQISVGDKVKFKKDILYPSGVAKKDSVHTVTACAPPKMFVCDPRYKVTDGTRSLWVHDTDVELVWPEEETTKPILAKPVPEPKDNRGRSICYWCRGKTTTVDLIQTRTQVCPTCKK